ncbi:hypothetical protein VPH35_107437 [Triticum aestivum]|uniref:uncharacterized protein n=1 Tax=Triticum aestivum TaxID=4565 RepID=UPI001D0104C4|nr:uncharacterized protein LOC123131473 [Triticum aestivum]
MLGLTRVYHRSLLLFSVYFTWSAKQPAQILIAVQCSVFSFFCPSQSKIQQAVYHFKCVSKPWRYLISDRNHRKRLPQTLAGFFYVSESWDNNRLCPIFEQHFSNLSGCQPPLVNPMLPFLPNHADMSVLDCCKGLLLLCHHKSTSSLRHYDYFVCNPATEKWVALPDLGVGDDDEFFPYPSCLVFDPAVSSHFHVFLYQEGIGSTGQVRIYSSRTGRWIIRDMSLNRWICLRSTVYFNGLLYFLTYEYVLVTMDLEAKELKEIKLPDAGGSTFFLLGQSQGCLWYVAKDEDENKISFWTLEDGAWSFNHSFPGSDCQHPVAFHPDCNTFFFTMGLENRLMSYNIDRGKARCLFVLGSGHFDWFRPYVPCFSDMLADED